MASAKKNTFREKPENTHSAKTELDEGITDGTKKAGKHKSKKSKPLPGKKFFAFLKDERFQKISGALLILLSIYMLLAFTSYLFTWQVDQDKVEALGWMGMLFGNNEIIVENWLGKFGAIISHQFIYRWFGVVSYLFTVLFFVYGFRLITLKWLYNPYKLLKLCLLAMLVFSPFVGYFVFNTKVVFLGGAFGYQVNLWLFALLGKIGTLLLLIFMVFGIIVVYFNPSFAISKTSKMQAETNHSQQENNKTNAIRNNLQEDELEKDEIHKYDLTNGIVDDIPDGQNEDKQNHLEITLEEGNTNKVTIIDESEDFSVEVGQDDAKELSEDEINNKLAEFGEYDPTLELSSYEAPSIELLEAYGSGSIVVNKEELEENKNRILDTLKNYNIEISKIKATVGPTVTLYEIVPAPGVRIAKIKNLEDDIALSLSALGIRIIAPIPGKGTIGIEVPNSKPEVVSMRSLIASEKFQLSEMELPVVLGKTIANETFVTDLTKMPHLLMAGATGQGKSVGLNAILVSLLYKKHPSQVKFVLVDPKKVELTLFNKIERHFLAKLPDSEEAIITENKKVVHTINSLCIEMDMRYELLKDAGVRNIKEYNAKFINRRLNPEHGHKYLPYIVLVVDEFADLIMTAGKEVETPIARLAQLARAIGIHLIIATQRPSVNIITGVIKANFPARIAFRVTSKIDSRTILDSGGAEQLIGRGDMLFSTGNDLIRIQCGFVDTHEVDKITEFIGAQRGYPSAFLLPEYVDENSDDLGSIEDEGERDELFEEAARIVVSTQQGSASLLQRKLKLGYNRAGRIVDQLEAAGVIGPFKGSKAREVLFKDMQTLEQFLSNLKQNNNNNNTL
jgi:S-DNA-T family DNA segregation ATPase FtsK/SpoIIIE